MATRIIKLFDKGNGCVQADGDRVVLFFDRACFVPEYSPSKGDRVVFNVRTNPVSGGLQAYQLQSLAGA